MQDPYLTLGVARDATDDNIHQAYLTAIRCCPAEQDPEVFQSIRTAYESIRTKKARLEYALFNTDLPTPADLLERLAKGSQPRRPGLDLFRELLRAGPRLDKK
ncbi:MAG: molecular chaperone DnaJ [Thiogranum sp.]